MKSFFSTQSLVSRVIRLAVTALSVFLLFQFVSLYLSWPKQIVVGVVSVVLVIVLNKANRSQVVTLAIMLLSLAATFRYGWWRIRTIVLFFTDESNNRLTINAVLMLILLTAELYTAFIMVLGYMQTCMPLRRKPIPLPIDESEWPHVDVLIPTYNEPLSLVRYTALAAINIDYPPEKLHVYILDDGTRPEFEEFCKQADVGYKVRKEHNHAKAGNINTALTTMNSPFVTIFDCDHVPTRSFLQVTIGWFLAEKKLAMLQTPHYFYSPDPFERNLLQYKTIPNEGELFYGIIQDGNDLWNATFFCGSCAVIRREALDSVGGIAVETVTEDAHTSLKMQKKGWNTAYINIPQAAGLATETLAAHVGQRVRWARGMVQIFRTDNPMLARGMKFTQRLCYFNAMLHFLYAVPRLIFLLAPLVYMICGLTIIPGYWVAILAYAMPHLVISSIVNSRVQGRHRHSFWNEIYETVLAPYILMPTVLALLNPKLGKFNVTDKGSTLAETHFDRHIAAPTTWLLALNVVGICMVPYRMRVTDPTHPGTVLSNLIWIFFNMVILGVAGAVANEQKQRRSSVRIPASIPIHIATYDEENPMECDGVTVDMSVGGASFRCSDAMELPLGTSLRVSFPDQTGKDHIGASIVGKSKTDIRLKFDNLTIAEQETLVRALYSRANSWMGARNNIEEDRPLVSLGRVIVLAFIGFGQMLRGLFQVRHKTAAALLFALLLAHSAHAQIPGAVNVNPAPRAQPAETPAAPLPASTPTAAAVVDDAVPLPPPDVTPLNASDIITLKDMGVDGLIPMHGPHSYYSEGFVLPHDRVPRKATLELTYHFNAQILPHSGSIRIYINGTPVGVINPPKKPQLDYEYTYVPLNISADLLTRNNEITFEFTGGAAMQMDKAANATVLASVGASSRMMVSGDTVPLKTDLGLLPMPFFDPDVQTTTTIPFVFLSQPTTETLRAAAVVASWFGIQASSKPIRYRVTVGRIPVGNVIVFSDQGSSGLGSLLNMPQGGASISIRTNPSDPGSSALVLAGDDDVQLLLAARSLALMPVAHPKPGETPQLYGQDVRLQDFPLPAERKPDDAPRWLTTEHLTSLWSYSSQQAMQSNGNTQIPVYFRVPPDLYYGETQNLNLRVSMEYNAKPLAEGSALRMYANGAIVNEAPLPPGPGVAQRVRNVMLPTANMRPFGNTFRFSFDFIPLQPGDNNLKGAILQNSALDIRGLDHWAKMPNLELFANAGFPFTRKADLSETTIVMPVQPSANEIALLLYLMSHCGTQTGYPAIRVEIAGPDTAMRGDRDYLILGGTEDQPAFTAMEPSLPVTLDGNGVHTKEPANYLRGLQRLWLKWQQLMARSPLMQWIHFDGPSSTPSNMGGAPEMMIEGIQSPYYPGRSVVVVSMRNDDAVEAFADVFLERSQSSDIAHSVSLLKNRQFQSYDMASADYHVGNISKYSLMRIWLVEHFWALMAALIVLSLIVAMWIRDYLHWLAATRLDPGKA